MNTDFFVYVLRSEKTNRLYVGSSSDLEKRLREHNSGHTKAIRYQRPYILIYSERFGSRAEAVRRERFLKTGQGREELKRLLKTDLGL